MVKIISNNNFEFNFVGLAIAFHSNYNEVSENSFTNNNYGISKRSQIWKSI